MSDEPSPRPWHTANFINGIEDANNGKVAANLRGEDAELIVKAVNERDRLRGIVRRLADDIERYHLVGERDRALLREARSALEEGGRS